MSHTSTDTANHAAPHGITLEGHGRFTFRHLGAVELAAYQRRRFEVERDHLRLLRDDYPPEEYAKRLDELLARFNRGEFDFLADVERAGLREGFDPASLTASQMIAVPELILRIMAVLTGRPDADNWKLLMSLPEETGRMIHQIISESFPQPPPDPKPQAVPAGDGTAES